jgi:hypothetical protein
LLGIGHRDGHWQLEPPEPAGGAEAGALRLARAGGALKLVFASNAHAAINLITNGHLGADDDAIIVHSLQVTPAMRRSPYARRGRRGRPGQRDVSLAALLGEAASAENLFDGFRQALAI